MNKINMLATAIAAMSMTNPSAIGYDRVLGSPKKEGSTKKAKARKKNRIAKLSRRRNRRK